MKIIIDAMGGDYAPQEIVKGAVMAVKDFDINIVLIGDSYKINEVFKNNNLSCEKIEIIHTTEIITNNESPTMAIRRKKDSSIVVGMKMLKNGEGDAFISAGNTGAILAAGLFIIGRIKGIDRAALAPIIPGKNRPFMLIDAGANAECKPLNIFQFALMGSIYLEGVLKRENPEISLVNIGSEEEKGTEFTKECYRILKDSNLNFIGNIEGREIPKGDTDIVVCDGFTGNTVLKMYEGVAETIFEILKKEIMSSTISKIGGIFLKPVFKKIKKKFDYTEYGGAILLGVDSAVIKAHGTSNATAIRNGIKQAIFCIDGKVIENIRDKVTKLNQ